MPTFTAEPAVIRYMAVTDTVVAGPVATVVLGSTSGTVLALDRAANVLTLAIPIPRATSPGVLRVDVGNGAPGGQAWFYLDAATVPFHGEFLDGAGAARNIQLPISGAALGQHTILVGSENNVRPAVVQHQEGGQGSQVLQDINRKSFEVTRSEVGAVVLPAGVEPPMPNQPSRWVFQAYDFSSLASVDTYVLPLNPSSMRRGFGSENITDEPTTVSNGKVISWEGAPLPPQWTFTGNVLTKDAHRQMARWGRTGQRFYITDHFGHRYLVKVQEYKVTRVRDVHRPWNHSYEMTCSVLRGTGVLV